MSELILGYKSPTHEIHVQIPVCLLGKPDLDFVPNMKRIASEGETVETVDVEEKQTTGIFKKLKKKDEKVEDKKKSGDGITVATGVLLLSSMILAALKD